MMCCVIIWDVIILMNFIKVLYCHLVSKHLPHVFTVNREMHSWDQSLGFWTGECLDSIQADKLGSKNISYHLNGTTPICIDTVLL